MQKFILDVQRIYTYKGTIEVEANSLEEAELMGFNLINDTELSMDSFNEEDDTVNDQTFGSIMLHKAIDDLKAGASLEDVLASIGDSLSEEELDKAVKLL